MNKKFLKVLAVAACAVLLVVGSVAGTLAYLTDKTDPITNTFTVGNVEITLTEAKVDVYGNPINDEGAVVDKADAPRVNSNKYKLVPGKTYTKDPIVSVTAGSEACWLFVKVDNGISEIEDDSSSIVSQMNEKGWTPLAGETDIYYHAVVDASNSEEDLPVAVFSTFTIDGAKTGNDMLGKAGASITVTAYAVQAEGFDSAAAAWEAAFAEPQS